MKTSATIYSAESRELVDNTQVDSVLLLDKHGLVVDFNCARHLNSPEISVETGRHYSTTLQHFTPISANGPNLQEQIENALRDGKSGDYAFHVGSYQCDGTAQLYKISVTALSMGAVVTYRNMSPEMAEKRKSDAYLQRIEVMKSHLKNIDHEMRKRLSRDLHDATSSNLSSILMYLDTIGSLQPESQAAYLAEHLDDIRALTEDSIKSIAEVCTNLRLHGVENQSLQQFIDTVVQKFRTRAGISVKLAMSAGRFDAPITIKLTMQRFFVEVMSNITRHANASLIEVDLQFDTSFVRLSVKDDGCGFDVNRETPRHGLQGIRELCAQAGGLMTINSAPEVGTTATLEFSGEFEKHDI